MALDVREYYKETLLTVLTGLRQEKTEAEEKLQWVSREVERLEGILDGMG